MGNRAAHGLVIDHGDGVREVGAGGKNPFGKEQRAALERARALSSEHHFFHWDLEFPEVFYDLQYARWKDDPGFDAVIGNPPYVRQEQVGAIKPYLAAEYATVHDGAADLYVYFYQKGITLLRGGGRLSYIVTNKWLRAGYGEGLRGYASRAARVERIVDFGHAPVFPDADVFPCIVLLRKRGEEEGDADSGPGALVCEVPREALGAAELGDHVRKHGYRVPDARFTSAPWSLEPPDVQRLMEKIRSAGAPLRQYTGAPPLYGIKTGFNEAFLIDGESRDRLVQQDPGSAELLRPFLRGQDIERWSAVWAGLWMILLRSSENHAWPWTGAPERKAEQLFNRAYPALYEHLKPLETQLRKRSDQGQYWWELRSCAYYEAFEQPKIMYQEIQFHSSYVLDYDGRFCNNKVFFLPTEDMYLLAVLNSPLMWWHNWRYLPHMKDEALSPVAFRMEDLPIATAPEAVRRRAADPVRRLTLLAKETREAQQQLFAWLQTEFNVDTPGQKLEEFATLKLDDFITEVKRRRPRGAPGLTPDALGRLKEAYCERAPRIREMTNEAGRLEERLAAIVNDAYGLTEADVELMWRTAPPRMPVRAPASRP
ncbi:MAG TPA: Eco57I restriction-modification methylase domain-containing protein, partial [Longimicrobium sp.]|nr:Eco57I restriction-modification methylase domain-containing protein [Longimicrobium sp.]